METPAIARYAITGDITRSAILNVPPSGNYSRNWRFRKYESAKFPGAAFHSTTFANVVEL
jgi:hypothetical protein